MRIVFFANTDWYLYNFRLPTALQLKASGHDVVMLSPGGDFGERFAEHGIPWLTLSMDRASLNPWRELQTLRHLVGVLREQRPQLLHNFTIKCAVYGSLAARAVAAPAVVNSVAGLGYVFASNDAKARRLRPFVSTLMRATLGRGRSRVILQNPDDAEALAASQLVPEHKLRVIRSSGVDLQRFHPDWTSPPARGPLRVLLAARLLWDKGLREFVEASALLKARGRDIEFLLAGMPDPGNPASATAEEARAWDQHGLVRWLEHVEDMPSLMRSVHAMALPSYYREGVPKSLIEAAASGLALVTTDLPGCREVVSEDGVDGLRVAPRDAHSLASAIARLDDDRELLARLGASARQRAHEHFDQRKVIRETMDVYDELVPMSAAMAEAG